MPTETNQTVSRRGSKKWMLAGIPALAAIAFIIYTAVVQGRADDASGADSKANSAAGSSATSDK